MSTAIVTVLLTFVLTGLTGGRLIQAWQHRNWRRQQQLLDAQNEQIALQDMFDEFATLSEKRRNRMQRLLLILGGDDIDLIKKRLSDYDDALIAWNDHLTPLYAKLSIYLTPSFAAHMEDVIQPAFLSVGQKLEGMTRRRLEGRRLEIGEVPDVARSLRLLARELFIFNRDVLNAIRLKRNSLYREASLTPGNLDTFPTWELFKALFKPWV